MKTTHFEYGFCEGFSDLEKQVPAGAEGVHRLDHGGETNVENTEFRKLSIARGGTQ